MSIVEDILLAAARRTLSVPAGAGEGVSLNDRATAIEFLGWSLARQNPEHQAWCNVNSPTSKSPSWCSCEQEAP